MHPYSEPITEQRERAEARQAVREHVDRVCPVEVDTPQFVWRIEYDGPHDNGWRTWTDTETGETVTLDLFGIDYYERLGKWKREQQARS